MANAAINILGDGSLYDAATMTGDLSKLAVRRLAAGVYEVEGTLGMVPPPDGWGTVTNPVDQISAAVSFQDEILRLETCDQTGQLVDIGSKLTLHICVPDAVIIAPIAPPRPVPVAPINEEYARRRAQADAMILPLQDMLDIGEGTAEIEARLLAWKRYRVALSRVSEQAEYPASVEWPVVPES